MKKPGSILLLVLIWALSLSAEEPPVPEGLQFPLLCKALTFDHQLASRSGDTLTFCVLFDPDERSSVRAKDRMKKAIDESGIGAVSGMPLVANYFPLDEFLHWQDSLISHDADIVYFTPQNGLDFDQIRDFTSSHLMLTVASDPVFVKNGMSLGITVSNDRPKLLINIDSAKREGASFSAQLLKLSEVVNGEY